MIKAAYLPISIIVINISKNTQENDSEKFIKNAFPAFKKSERVYVDLLDFESYKNEQGVHTVFFAQQFEYDLIQNIPKQIEKFFEINNYESEHDLFNHTSLDNAIKKSITTTDRGRVDVRISGIARSQSTIDGDRQVFPDELFQSNKIEP